MSQYPRNRSERKYQCRYYSECLSLAAANSQDMSCSGCQRYERESDDKWRAGLSHDVENWLSIIRHPHKNDSGALLKMLRGIANGA